MFLDTDAKNEIGDQYAIALAIPSPERSEIEGFMHLESAGSPGIFGTGPLLWRSGEPRLNVQSGHEVQVQVTDMLGKTIEGYGFDDREPFSGDELFWEPR